MLQETQDLSLSLGAGVRMPTGEKTTGNGVTAVSPFIAFWRDLGAKWQARGGIGADVFTDGASTLPDAVFRANLALGTTLSAHASAPLGDLTPYVSMNSLSRHREWAGHDHVQRHAGHSYLPGLEHLLYYGRGNSGDAPRALRLAADRRREYRVVRAS